MSRRPPRSPRADTICPYATPFVSQCRQAEHIFGHVVGERRAAKYGVPLLGSLPLEIAIREQGDAGTPIVAAAPYSTAAEAYRQLARNIVAEPDKRPRAAAPTSASLL